MPHLPRHAQGLKYEVDAQDRLVAKAGSWDRFALDNGWSAGAWDLVREHSLWDFITDRATTEVYQGLLDQVRRTHASLSFDLRCDSPWLKRHLRMYITPGELEGWVNFSTRLIRLESLNLPFQFVWGKGPREEAVSCSFCNKVRLPQGWTDLGSGLSRPHHETVLHLSPEVCPQCSERLAQLAR